MRVPMGVVGVLALVSLLPQALWAQATVSAYQEREFRLGLSLTSGPIDIFGGSAGFGWLRRTDVTEVSFAGETEYLEINDRTQRNSSSATVGVDLWPRRRWSPFALTHWLSNRPRRIANRLAVGVGVKRLLVDHEKGKHSISAALLYEEEESTSRLNLERQEVVLSLRTKNLWRFENEKQLALVGFFQWVVDDPSNYRVDLDLRLDLPLTETVKFRLSVIDEYGSRPFVTTERNYLSTRLSLVFRGKRGEDKPSTRGTG